MARAYNSFRSFVVVLVLLMGSALLATEEQYAAEEYESASRMLGASDDGAYVGFHETVQMPIGRSDHLVELFADHVYDSNGPRIYITGGCTGDQKCKWNQACYNPYTPANTCVVCECSDYSASTIYFTPETKPPKYTAIADAPTRRYRGQGAKRGTQLWVFGGRSLTSTPPDAIVESIDILETTTGIWSTFTAGTGAATDLRNSTAPVSDGGAFSYDGKIYIVGGYDAQYAQVSTLYSIDPSTTPWTVDMSLPSMSTGRGDISLQLFKGEFYVIGGWNSAFTEALATVESFNPRTKTWTTRPSMLYARGDLAVGVMGNSLFAIAGEQRDPAKDPNGDTLLSFPVPWVTRFTLASNKFQMEQPLPVSRFRFVGTSYNSSSNYLNSAIYLFGGQTDYDSKTKSFHISNGTLKYIPVSTYTSQFPKKLSAGEIAGIVIGVIVAAGAIALSVVGYLLYRHRGYYLKQDVQLSRMSVQRLDGDDVEDGEASPRRL